MKTYSLKPSDVARKWYVLDAADVPLGRLATVAAGLLIGKGKTTTSPHIDNGDFVVVINSDSLKLSGDKRQKKTYFRHSGYPGGLHKRSLDEQMKMSSEKVIESAVRGMLPVNKLRPGRLKRLKIYANSEHSNAAQKPLPIEVVKLGANK